MPSAWSSATMPRPPRKAATGASSSSASARTASLACCAPLPVMIIGRLAAASSLAAASTSSGDGAAGLLVPGADGADGIAALLQGVEQRVELGAGEAEHRVDAVGNQRLDDRHAAGHRCGLAPLPHRSRTLLPAPSSRHIKPWRADL